MISFYSWSTANGHKVAILLEELGLDYETVTVYLGRNEQFAPGFLAISPNNKIPAIVDHGAEGGPLSVFESGAILTYLAERHGRFLPAAGAARYKTLEWLNWQMGGLCPVLGQLGYFEKLAQEKSAAASARFLAEADRLLSVMDKRLAGSTYLAGEQYGIADIAAYPWAVTASTFLADVLAERIGTKPALLRWMEQVGGRPAVRRGMAVPANS